MHDTVMLRGVLWHADSESGIGFSFGSDVEKFFKKITEKWRFLAIFSTKIKFFRKTLLENLDQLVETFRMRPISPKTVNFVFWPLLACFELGTKSRNRGRKSKIEELSHSRFIESFRLIYNTTTFGCAYMGIINAITKALSTFAHLYYGAPYRALLIRRP